MAADLSQARQMVIRLLDEAKLTPVEVSELMGGRVSPRTIYRWARGESQPQNQSDFDALQKLVERIQQLKRRSPALPAPKEDSV